VSLSGRLRSPDAVALGLAGLATATLYWFGRGLSFFFDEWNFILDRRGNSVGDYLAPHNGHLSLVPVVIYKILLATFGLRHYGPYRLVAIGIHLACATFVYLIVRRRVGGVAALLPFALLLFLGRAWEDLLWPFQIGYFAAIAAALGAYWLLDRADDRGDRGACVLLAVSLGSSGLGIPLWIGAAAKMIIDWRPWSRWWVLAAPLALYLGWYARYGHSDAQSSNVSKLPRYVFDSYAGAAGALCGVPISRDRPIAVLFLFALAALIWWRRRNAVGAVAPAVAALAFWVLTGLTRAQYNEPAASRYIYPGAVLLILVVAEILRGYVIPLPALAALAVLTVFSIAGNMGTLRDAANGQRNTDASVDAALAVTELERAHVPGSFRPDPVRAPQVTAARYFAATADFGSPALPLAMLPSQAPNVRSVADDTFVRAVAASSITHRHVRTAGAAPPHVDGSGLGVVRTRESCDLFDPVRHATIVPSAVDVVVPPAGLLIRATGAVQLFIRRLGDDYPATPSLRIGRGETVVAPPPDALPQTWRVRLATTKPVAACGTQ
jgi:hypothetical protein